METDPGPAPIEQRRREVLREASVALGGRAVTLWEVSPTADVVPIDTSAADPHGAPPDTRLDLESTLHRWSAPIIQGSRWVGCLLNGDRRWCVAPVRQQPPAPPPNGVERRSPARITLELAGLCLGLIEQYASLSRGGSPFSPVSLRPRLAEPDALVELARQPSVIAHEVANPLTAALAGLDMARVLVREASMLDPHFQASLLAELAGVGEGMEQAIQFLRSIQDRARGGLARSERFDAGAVVRSCVALERPLARNRGVALQGVVSVSNVFLQGDPNGLYQIVTNLVRNAVAASQVARTPVVVTLDLAGDALRLAVEDHGVGIAAEHLERIFEPGFTTREFGSGSGTGLTVVAQITQEMFGGRVDVSSTAGRGARFTVTLPIPPQRTGRS